MRPSFTFFRLVKTEGKKEREIFQTFVPFTAQVERRPGGKRQNGKKCAFLPFTFYRQVERPNVLTIFLLAPCELNPAR